MTDIWSYRDTARTEPTDVVGFEVVATDGSIGKVDGATYDAGASYLVVDTGPGIFGKKRMRPAGVIDRDRLRRPAGVRQPGQGPDPGCSRLRPRPPPGGGLPQRCGRLRALLALSDTG